MYGTIFKLAILPAIAVRIPAANDPLAIVIPRATMMNRYTVATDAGLFVGRRSRFLVFANRHGDESYNAATEERSLGSERSPLGGRVSKGATFVHRRQYAYFRIVASAYYRNYSQAEGRHELLTQRR